MKNNTHFILPLLVVLAALAGFSVARAGFAPGEPQQGVGGVGIVLGGSIPIDEGTGLLSASVIRQSDGGLLLVTTLAEVNEFGLLDTSTAVRGLAQDSDAEIEVAFSPERGFVIAATPGTWRDAVTHHGTLTISRS